MRATLAEGPTYNRDVIRWLPPLVVLVVALVPSTVHAHEVRDPTGLAANIPSAHEMASSALHGQAAQIESASPSPPVRPKQEKPQGGVVTFGGIVIAGLLIGGLLLMRSRLLRR
jgi:hypothetical protein